MKVLAVIPARRGSKRVPDKNVQDLGGKPLVMWTIDAALSVPEIDDVLVTTDDERVAGMAQAAGALVPWLRPAALATDEATSVDVVLHALEWYEHEKGPVEAVLLLQPTSPFRGRETIHRAIDQFSRSARRGVVSVSPAKSHPDWCFVIEGGSLSPYVRRDGGQAATRHQDLPAAYALNGAIYVMSPSRLRHERTFLSKDVVPLVMEDAAESLDIDTPLDLSIARCLLARSDVQD